MLLWIWGMPWISQNSILGVRTVCALRETLASFMLGFPCLRSFRVAWASATSLLIAHGPGLCLGPCATQSEPRPPLYCLLMDLVYVLVHVLHSLSLGHLSIACSWTWSMFWSMCYTVWASATSLLIAHGPGLCSGPCATQSEPRPPLYCLLMDLVYVLVHVLHSLSLGHLSIACSWTWSMFWSMCYTVWASATSLLIAHGPGLCLGPCATQSEPQPPLYWLLMDLVYVSVHVPHSLSLSHLSIDCSWTWSMSWSMCYTVWASATSLLIAHGPGLCSGPCATQSEPRPPLYWLLMDLVYVSVHVLHSLWLPKKLGTCCACVELMLAETLRPKVKLFPIFLMSHSFSECSQYNTCKIGRY